MTKYRIGPAGPGVLFGGIVAAILVKFTFPYGWSWIDALLFGAITAATDPVAVVAVLKEVCLAASAPWSPTKSMGQLPMSLHLCNLRWVNCLFSAANHGQMSLDGVAIRQELLRFSEAL